VHEVLSGRRERWLAHDRLLEYVEGIAGGRPEQRSAALVGASGCLVA
jgi:hypothetical protein